MQQDAKGGGKDAPKDPRAEIRFPQPVRVGDLRGRSLIVSMESQHLLGWVKGVVRRADGDMELVVETGDLLSRFGMGTRDVVVPTDAVALLG